MQLVYSDAALLCQIVTQEQAENQGAAGGSNKRSRRGRAHVTVAHTNTLADLKLRSFETLKVHPLNMRCYVNGRLLADDRATLAALDVAADDVVNVVRISEEEDVNFESLIAYKESMCSDSVAAMPTSRAGARAVKERGFAHTALVGGSPAAPRPAEVDGGATAAGAPCEQLAVAAPTAFSDAVAAVDLVAAVVPPAAAP